MFVTDSSCSHCDISTKNSHQAFFIRLLPGSRYMIICDRCLARERRHLEADDPALEGVCSSTSLGEESLQRVTGSMQKTLLAATHHWIENLSLSKIHDLPIISTLFRSYKRSS